MKIIMQKEEISLQHIKITQKIPAIQKVIKENPYLYNRLHCHPKITQNKN